MARLYLFAEGQTEQTFADTVLKPHLAHFDVFMQKPVLIAHARRKGVVHRGGGRKYLPMRNDIGRFLKQERAADTFFTTMIDLYALPTDFPGRAAADRLRHDPPRRVLALQEAWAADIPDPRFIPFIQLHEFEAYLFVDAAQFEFFYSEQKHKPKIANLQAIADAAASPELIDDGPQSAPSKRIIGEFPDYSAAKAVIGPQIAGHIGLAAIRDKCPHFHHWLTRLERLHQQESTL